MRIKSWIDQRIIRLKESVRKMMKCICSGEQLNVEEIIPSPDSLATRDYSASGYSSRTGENDTKIDTSNIEEAESSLRESDFLNYEEARALLGRLEFQKGNVEGALYVFEGIDITAVFPKMKLSIMSRCEHPRRHSSTDPLPTMSIHAVSLLFEAIFLKAKCLQALGRFTASQSCKVLLDTVESASPEGLPGDFAADCKFQETINKAVELLPDLCILSWAPEGAILAYRRALLYQWNLDMETRTKVEKNFAVFLLYSGTDATSPNLRSQMESSFVPRNNVEEAALLLLILLRKFSLRKIGWDPSILHHLSFALTIAGDFRSLAYHVEELPPGIMERREQYNTLALCYYGEGDGMVAINLLRNLLNVRENQTCITELLLASKICAENSDCIQEGIGYVRKYLSKISGRCNKMVGVAHSLLGISLSSQSRIVVSDLQRISRQAEAIEALETAENMTRETDPNVFFHLSLINAEQRKLDVALYYAKQQLKYEAGSSVKGWILLARILSAQRRYFDAENIINAALDETGKWDQGELMRTKAKLQIAQGQIGNAVETYKHLLAVLQVRSKNFGVQKKLFNNRGNSDRILEMETWNDLANVYTNLSQWRDAEVCLSKSSSINPHSASRWYSLGWFYKGRGLHAEALKYFKNALDVDSRHVPSLIATGITLRKLNDQSLPVVKSFLTDALTLDRTNSSAWYNLGLLYKVENGGSAVEAAECFEAAAILEESEPVEPFR
ncbi:protein NPGR2-like isoform X2 [Apium graveolens]|uniref:protein NPGR2-like isoform X2 n=1 Tax=Apium graveolens TaxID=4045 RepID=UPI003D7BEF9B